VLVVVAERDHDFLVMPVQDINVQIHESRSCQLRRRLDIEKIWNEPNQFLVVPTVDVHGDGMKS
jgi:hypothetical protein